MLFSVVLLAMHGSLFDKLERHYTYKGHSHSKCMAFVLGESLSVLPLIRCFASLSISSLHVFTLLSRFLSLLELRFSLPACLCLCFLSHSLPCPLFAHTSLSLLLSQVSSLLTCIQCVCIRVQLTPLTPMCFNWQYVGLVLLTQ